VTIHLKETRFQNIKANQRHITAELNAIPYDASFVPLLDRLKKYIAARRHYSEKKKKNLFLVTYIIPELTACVFMMHIHDEVHTSSSNGSLVITNKPEVFFFFRMTTTLLLGTFAQSRKYD
jgi:hypothetical protein